MKHTTSQGERSRTVTRLITVISTGRAGLAEFGFSRSDTPEPVACYPKLASNYMRISGFSMSLRLLKTTESISCACKLETYHPSFNFTGFQ